MDILKEALLLEKRGQAFYRTTAEQAAHTSVKEFFQTMADEEAHHVRILEEQFRGYSQSSHFSPMNVKATSRTPLADMVLSDDLKQQIAAADFESAAVSAAMLMEEKAVALYSKQAETSQNENEKALYQWLTDWEQGHLSFLARLDREIKESLWEDNRFWPF
jgi:rubrerythrin